MRFICAAISRMYGCQRLEFEIDAHKAFLVKPAKPVANGARPWIWYAPTFLPPGYPNNRHEWILSRLLAEGFYVSGIDVGESYGNAEGRRLFQEHYLAVTSTFGLSSRACLMPQSRGGLMLYNWAAEHPDAVQCVGGIYTVCNLASWPGLPAAAPAYGMTAAQLQEHLAENNPVDRLAPLAAKKVPILHVHGDADGVVPLEQNSAELALRYKALGGEMEIEIIPGKGHEEVDEFFQSQRLVDFFLEQGKK